MLMEPQVQTTIVVKQKSRRRAGEVKTWWYEVIETRNCTAPKIGAIFQTSQVHKQIQAGVEMIVR